MIKKIGSGKDEKIRSASQRCAYNDVQKQSFIFFPSLLLFDVFTFKWSTNHILYKNSYHSISSSSLNFLWHFGVFILIIAISFSTFNTFFNIVKNDINEKYTSDLLFPLLLVLWMYHLAWRIQKFTSNIPEPFNPLYDSPLI